MQAGLVAKPEDWAWSSAAAYLGGKPAPDWLRTTTILEMFGVAARREYRAFLDEDVDGPTRESYEAWQVGPRKGGQTRGV